jgi:hypothetical protein
MGSGIKSESTSGQMRSGGTMGSGVKSGASNGQMRSGGAMNSTPRSSSTSTYDSKRSANGNTTYQYKTYTGPRETRYNGRNVYVNNNGGYSYYQGGPVIAYMPGYTPVMYTQPSSGLGTFAIAMIILAIALVLGFIVFVIRIR